MREFAEKYEIQILIAISLMCISSGAIVFIPIWQSLPILFGIWGLIAVIIRYFKNDAPERELIGHLDDCKLLLDEQKTVIDEYEQIFDGLLVRLPCICGGNTFEGLFSPNTDNEVVCEHCKNKYRVSIQYDTVLISEPLDNNRTFDKLVGDIS